jgi:hypothetical protein
MQSIEDGRLILDCIPYFHVCNNTYRTRGCERNGDGSGPASSRSIATDLINFLSLKQGRV